MSSTIATPLSVVNVPPATLQAWLAAAQGALQSLMIGQTVASASYGQGEGTKSVTYTRTNVADLRAWIATLQIALGNGRPRAIGVMFR